MIKSNKKISLLKVKIKDETMLYRWANEKSVRKWSFNSSPIKLLNHKKWFNKNINNKKIQMWKLKYNSNLCGLVRIKLMNKNFILSYLITKKFRGNNLGEKMLNLALKKIRKKNPGAKVFAKSLSKNFSSSKTLIKSGFILFKKNSYINIYVNNGYK